MELHNKALPLSGWDNTLRNVHPTRNAHINCSYTQLIDVCLHLLETWIICMSSQRIEAPLYNIMTRKLKSLLLHALTFALAHKICLVNHIKFVSHSIQYKDQFLKGRNTRSVNVRTLCSCTQNIFVQHIKLASHSIQYNIKINS